MTATTTGDGRQAVHDQLRAFDAICKEFDDIYRDTAKRLGLSGSAFDILYALGEEDGCTQQRLVSLCYTSKQTVNSSIKRLVSEGLASLEHADARRTRVWLTDAGRALVHDKINPVAAAECRAFGSLAPCDRAALLRAGRAYMAALRMELEVG